MYFIRCAPKRHTNFEFPFLLVADFCQNIWNLFNYFLPLHRLQLGREDFLGVRHIEIGRLRTLSLAVESRKFKSPEDIRNGASTLGV